MEEKCGTFRPPSALPPGMNPKLHRSQTTIIDASKSTRNLERKTSLEIHGVRIGSEIVSTRD